MNLDGRNNPCGAKEQGRDEVTEGLEEIILKAIEQGTFFLRLILHVGAQFAGAFAGQLAKLAVEARKGHIAHLAADILHRHVLGKKHCGRGSDADPVNIIEGGTAQYAVKFPAKCGSAHTAELRQCFDGAWLCIVVCNVGECRRSVR